MAHTVIADLIRNPEVNGGATIRQPNRQNPLSLDGRGIKGEGENKTVPPPCHSEQSEESKISDPHDPHPVDTALKPA